MLRKRRGRRPLAEAQPGTASASIVAQTFIRVLWDTPNSIVHSRFRPDPKLVRLAPGVAALQLRGAARGHRIGAQEQPPLSPAPHPLAARGCVRGRACVLTYSPSGS
jgi:hypothetical protein